MSRRRRGARALWIAALWLTASAAHAGGLPRGSEPADGAPAAMPHAAAGAPEAEAPAPAPATDGKAPAEAQAQAPDEPQASAAAASASPEARVVAPDPAARRPGGDEAGEHWDLAAHFRSGHRIYARFLITNQGPGEDTAVAFGHVVTPAGDVVEFQNGRREGAWRITADGRHLEIGSSELHFDPGVRRLVVDNQKRQFELAVTLPADGSARSAPPIPGGAQLDLLNLASPASGRLRLGGGTPVALDGRAVLTHAWSARDARGSGLRRLDVATFHADRNLFLSEWRSDTGRRWRWVVLAARGGEPPGPFTLELRTDEPEGVRYPIPSQLELRGKDIRGTITLGGPRVLEVDPIHALPGLVKLLYSFGSPRHVWLDASLDVTVGAADTASDPVPPAASPRLRIQGPALASVFFLDAVSP